MTAGAEKGCSFQAASLSAAVFQFPGRSRSSFWMLWSLMRASTSARHACGSDVVHARGLDQSVHHGRRACRRDRSRRTATTCERGARSAALLVMSKRVGWRCNKREHRESTSSFVRSAGRSRQHRRSVEAAAHHEIAHRASDRSRDAVVAGAQPDAARRGALDDGRHCLPSCFPAHSAADRAGGSPAAPTSSAVLSVCSATK
jgi:hypothetical protein